MISSDKSSAFALKVVLTVIFFSIIATYYFELLASPGAGGYGRVFIELRSSIVSPIGGYIISLVILKLFKRLNKTTARYLLLNLLLVFIFLPVLLFGAFITTTSESMFKIFGEPTIELKELTVNSDSSCNYKIMIKNKSPIPIINARLWAGSLIYIKFTNSSNYPASECNLAGENFFNLYPGDNVIDGVTTNFGNNRLGITTLQGLTSTSLNAGYSISAYIEIEMYTIHHQTRIDYSNEKQRELMKLIYSLR